MNSIQSTQVASALKLATRNVMSPGIWISGVVGVPCISGAAWAGGWIAVWLLSILTIIILTNLGIYLFHSIRSPNLLQSEDYLLKKEAMNIYGSSSYSGEQVVKIINSENQLTISDRGASDEQ